MIHVGQLWQYKSKALDRDMPTTLLIVDLDAPCPVEPIQGSREEHRIKLICFDSHGCRTQWTSVRCLNEFYRVVP